MKVKEAKIGRIFVIRLEDKDKLPDTIETFAKNNNILRGMCILIGGISANSKIVVGPIDENAEPIVPKILDLYGISEVAGVGTIFPDEQGNPKIHLHASFGKGEKVLTGCIRPGIEVWQLGEIILLEIINDSIRKKNKETGFLALEP